MFLTVFISSLLFFSNTQSFSTKHFFRSQFQKHFTRKFLYESKLRSFSLVTFWLRNFLAPKYCKKARIKCWWNWPLDEVDPAFYNRQPWPLKADKRLNAQKNWHLSYKVEKHFIFSNFLKNFIFWVILMELATY